MCKIKLLIIIICVGIGLPSIGKNHLKQASDTKINVKTFGAKGDGVTDDYNALIAAANFMTHKGSGTLFFPKGTYFIKTYKTTGKQYADIEFTNCTGLNVIGDHAVISVNGNFKRTKDFEAGSHGNGNSYTNAIIPFLFTKCKNVLIQGFEMNGNVNQMTRDEHLAEGRAHLILLNECDNVVLRDLYLHHAQSDGIYITGVDKPSFNVKIYNVTSSNNARQGMSITGLSGGEFVNCKFISTGVTQGNYGFHPPGAGVDIEPRTFKDYKTGNVVFTNCTFADNTGGQFICTSPQKTSNVVLRNCIVKAGANSSKYTMILSAVNINIDSCNIECLNGDIYAKGKYNGSSVNINNCTIKSNFSGIVAKPSDDTDTLNINNNTLICTATDGLKAYFPYLVLKNVTFINNKIFIPSAIVGSKRQTSLIQNAIVSKGNKFYSDKNNVKPVVSYTGTSSVNDL